MQHRSAALPIIRIQFAFVSLVFGFLTSIVHSVAQAEPEIAVISDIDDTIQKTQVRFNGALFSFISNVMRSHDSFVGMPALYSILASNGIGFHYVSGAPRFLSAIPAKFLESSGFPEGELSVRPSLRVSTTDFKIARIRDIMRTSPGTKFILIGDNGEYDVEVYRTIATDPEFKDRIMLVSIHKLYGPGVGMPLASGQRSYITTTDLVLDFVELRLLNETQAEVVLRQIARALVSGSRSIRGRTIPEFAVFTSEDVINLYNRSASIESPLLRQLVAQIAELKSQYLPESDQLRESFFRPRSRTCRDLFSTGL